ncbi:MAG: DNA polymerase III subunit gamma/tau [Treponema sp.]|nr:DNA polymerase III subunit gamma/tau [Treponema sp.]
MSDSPAYEVTATKRRPKTFDELAGQEFVVSTLKNSLKSGSIAHAYLFSGPRGCGKTSAARILARALNCESPQNEKGPAENPCGICDNCRSIAAGASMDVIEIDGASNTSVNDVRQIKDEVLFPPQAGRYKVYIIDEVHMLSNNAFNALLKTIEEPPPYIIFIFATTELHKVPATIKSRCQQFNFRLIAIETIQAILKNICGELGVEAEDNALFWIARESTGSLRDAFTLFDQVASFSGGHIRENLIREKLGLAGLETINALAEACAANDAPAAFSHIDAILSSGVAIEQLIIDLAGYYRGLLLVKNGISRESLLGYSRDQFSEKVLNALDGMRLEQALDILLACYRDIRYSVSPRFELETAVSKLAWLGQWVSPVELKAALDGARRVLGAHAGSAAANTSGGAPGPRQEAQSYASRTRHRNDEEQAIADECRRILTADAGQPRAEPAEDNDEPVWSGHLRNTANEPRNEPQGDESPGNVLPGDESQGDESPGNVLPGDESQGDESQGDESQGDESPVDRVLRLIPGTLVDER